MNIQEATIKAFRLIDREVWVDFGNSIGVDLENLE